MSDVTTTTTAPDATTTTATNTSPYYTGLFKQDGALDHSSFDRLPEDVRYLKDSFSKYKTADDLFRGIANQQTMAGQKGLIPLPDNAPPEAVAKRKELLDSIHGVPKTAKDYQSLIKRPDSIPERYWDPELVNGFADWAFENSTSPKAAQKLIAMQLGKVEKQIAAQAQYEKDFFAKHDSDFNEAIRQKNMPRDQADSLVERGAVALGFDPANPDDAVMLKNSKVKLAMMNHALATGEDTFARGDNGNSGGGDAMTQMNDIMHNKLNPLYEPLYNSSHPQHKQASQRVDELARLAAAKRQ